MKQNQKPTRDPVLISIVLVCLGLYAAVAYMLYLTVQLPTP